MNWAAFWHLCGVLLLVLNGVRGSDEDQLSHPTTSLRPRERRPLRVVNIGNAIKPEPEGNFKPSQYYDSSTSSSPLPNLSRLTSKRLPNVDYLARNTVPVAPVTEPSRKLSKNRPPPSHLLAFQAMSTTDRVVDKIDEAALSPTGWALASLGPSKNASSPASKKANQVQQGTAKPFNNYWSVRLKKPALKPTTALPPTNYELGDEYPEKNRTVLAIPAENLIQNDNETTKRDQLDANVPPVTTQPTARSTELREKNTTAPAGTREDDSNAGSNLIKGSKGGGSSSIVLSGAVLASLAPRITDSPQVDLNVTAEPNVTVTFEKTETMNTTGVAVNSPVKLLEEVETIEPTTVITEVVNASLPATSKASDGFLPIQSDAAEPQIENSTSLASMTEKFTTTLGSSKVTESTTRVAPKMANLVENFISPTAAPFETNSTVPLINEQSVTTNATKVLPPITTPIIDIPQTVTSAMPTLTPTTEPTTIPTKVSNSTLLANSMEVVTTTVSEEINDIPEAVSHIKSHPDGVEVANRATTVAPPVTTTVEHNTSSIPNHSNTISAVNFTVLSASVSSPFAPVVTNDSFGSPTTELTADFDVATSTQNIVEVTTSPQQTEPNNRDQSTTTSGPVIVESVMKKDEDSVENQTDSHTTTTLEPLISKTVPTVDKITDKSVETGTESFGITETPTTLLDVLIPLTTVRPLVTLETTTASRPITVVNTSQEEPVSTEDSTPLDNKPENEDDHDETLKYNVTIVDPLEKPNNASDSEPTDYTDNSEKDSEYETDKESEPPSTTTLVIIEEITTVRESSTSQNATTEPTITSTDETTTEGIRTITPSDSNEDDEPRLRLTFQASFKEVCSSMDRLAKSISSFFKDVVGRPIAPTQVNVLNLGMSDCSSKALPFTEKVPVVLQITDDEGKGDRNLTSMLYSYTKEGRIHFKHQLTSVEWGSSPLVTEDENQSGGTVVAAIVISSVAGISLLCLTILLVIMRKRQKGFTYGQRCTPVSLEDYSLDNMSVFNSVRRKAMRASKRSYGNPAFDDPVTVTNPLNFVGLSNMANSQNKIDNEFSEVPTVTVKPDELPMGAETKNRYANVIPIPETRVPLSGPDREEVFINANYVKGVKGAEKFYIACQGPLDSTIADFWAMIWEQQTQVVLMLTDLHENGVEKCADYLPPSEVLDCHRVFGDFQVTLKKREVREKYVISCLQLKNLETNLWREVNHLWYTSWPIRGVPDDLPSIIAYLIEARSYSKSGHPIVVHCSPGTGRTGTIIAVDMAIRDFETERTVDIPKTVYSIRRDRAGAVQTNLQYYLIYRVIHLYATKLTGGGLDSI